MEITGIIDLDNIILRYKREMEHIDNYKKILKQIRGTIGYIKIKNASQITYCTKKICIRYRQVYIRRLNKLHLYIQKLKYENKQWKKIEKKIISYK